ncbi:MAG: hypothetical protein ACE5E8_02630, partial [Acidimicrobiia bacterium]
FIGIANSLVDIWMNVIARLYRPEKVTRSKRSRRASAAAGLANLDWETVLHDGTVDVPRHRLPGRRRLPPRVRTDDEPAHPHPTRMAVSEGVAEAVPSWQKPDPPPTRHHGNGDAAELIVGRLVEYLATMERPQQISLQLDGTSLVITLEGPRATARAGPVGESPGGNGHRTAAGFSVSSDSNSASE